MDLNLRAMEIEKKLRKRCLFINLTIHIIAFIVVALLYFYLNVIFIFLLLPYFLIYKLFIEKKVLNHFASKPMSKVLAKDMNVELHSAICNHIATISPMNGWLLSAATGEGDFQKMVDIACHHIKNSKNKRFINSNLCCLMAVYYGLNDTEKLRILKEKYDELLPNYRRSSKQFYHFIDCYLKGDIEGCKKHINKFIKNNKALPFNTARSFFHLGLLNFRSGNTEEAKENFEKVCQIAPNIYFAQYAKSYIDAINNGESYDHAAEIGEILPDENYVYPFKRPVPTKKQISARRIHRVVLVIIGILFILVCTDNVIKTKEYYDSLHKYEEQLEKEREAIREYEEKLDGAISRAYYNAEVVTYFDLQKGDVRVAALCLVKNGTALDIAGIVTYDFDETFDLYLLEDNVEISKYYCFKSPVSSYYIGMQILNTEVNGDDFYHVEKFTLHNKTYWLVIDYIETTRKY